MAKAHRARPSWPEAAEALEKAISLNARISRYYYLLSAVYRRLGRAEESEEALATFQKLEHESAQRKSGLRTPCDLSESRRPEAAQLDVRQGNG